MREIDAIKIVVALCLASTGALLPSAAKADDKDTLVQDIRAFVQRCDGKSKETLSPLCANQWAELHRRQDALHLTNQDVNAKMVTTRGGRHGGGPWFP